MIARTAHTPRGKKQITAFYVPGDMPDIHELLLPSSTGLEALCESKKIRVSRSALANLFAHYPVLGVAFCREALSDFAIETEWLINVGQRQAKARIAHLICEMAFRIVAVWAPEFDFPFPITQG
jgi:CRP-like cAMP-binding protein